LFALNIINDAKSLADCLPTGTSIKYAITLKEKIKYATETDAIIDSVRENRVFNSISKISNHQVWV
ncbi:MAG: hypothetical protein ABUK13_05690, partial [Gammaproteobacteria bacterium]